MKTKIAFLALYFAIFIQAAHADLREDIHRLRPPQTKQAVPAPSIELREKNLQAELLPRFREAVIGNEDSGLAGILKTSARLGLNRIYLTEAVGTGNILVSAWNLMPETQEHDAQATPLSQAELAKNIENYYVGWRITTLGVNSPFADALLSYCARNRIEAQIIRRAYPAKIQILVP